MSKRFIAFAAALTVLVAAAVALAQQPRVVNGRVATQPAGTLAQTVQGIGASHADGAWVGYTLPMIAGERHMCCDNGNGSWNGNGCCACRLEPSSGQPSAASPATGGGP